MFVVFLFDTATIYRVALIRCQVVFLLKLSHREKIMFVFVVRAWQHDVDRPCMIGFIVED